jgi:hypothetical protein
MVQQPTLSIGVTFSGKCLSGCCGGIGGGGGGGGGDLISRIPEYQSPLKHRSKIVQKYINIADKSEKHAGFSHRCVVCCQTLFMDPPAIQITSRADLEYGQERKTNL